MYHKNKLVFTCCLIVIIIFIGCKSDQGQKPKLESVITIEIDSSKAKNSNILTKQDSLKIDFSNDYIKYIINYNLENFGLYFDLNYDDVFVKVRDKSDSYLNHAISLLELNKLSQDKKEIVILSMASLSIDNRVKFIEKCYELQKKGILSERELLLSFDHYFGDKKLYFEYKNKEVIVLLNKIIADDELSNPIKEKSKEILEGKQSKRFRKDKEYLTHRDVPYDKDKNE
jgi:hypothetical protein